MFRSIRWNFLGWFALVLTLAIGGFGGTLYSLVRGTKLGEIDTELEGAAQILADRLRSRGPPAPFRGDRGGDQGPFHDDMFRESPDSGPKSRRHSKDRGPPPGRESSPDSLELPESFVRRLGDEAGPSLYFAVWRSSGDLFKASNLPPGIQRPSTPKDGDDIALILEGNRREIVLRGPRDTLVLVGRSIESELTELSKLCGFIVGVGAVVLGIGLVGAWFIAKRTVRPIEVITRTAESISGSNLSERIEVTSKEIELKRLAEVLNSAFDRIQGDFERQARFTADASHELRTPVAVILAQTEMARRKERTPAEYRESIEACYSTAKRMKRLVDDLLTLTRADAGSLHLQIAEVDLAQIVEECMDALEPIATEHGLRLQRDFASVQVEGDPEKLAQVVSNLLGNAIRYNRQGGEIKASVQEEGGFARLCIADTGIGISSADLPRIFDRFFCADPARSPQEGGTGLGLAIVKGIVEAHSGSIVCASEVARGTTFTLMLPLKHAAPAS